MHAVCYLVFVHSTDVYNGKVIKMPVFVVNERTPTLESRQQLLCRISESISLIAKQIAPTLSERVLQKSSFGQRCRKIRFLRSK